MAEGPGAAPPPHGCPGTSSAQAGRAAACQGCPSQGLCAAGGPAASDPAIEEIKEKMKIVKHKILVLSGKGGVGKSTFSAHLAHGLAKDETKQIALLDIDICGPSIPKIMGIEGEQRQMLRNRVRRLRQRGEDMKSERGTDLSQSTGPRAVDFMVAMGHVDAVERRFWALETSTDWWDRIVLQVWDESQWLRNFRMRKGTFLELCELLSPALKRKDTRMRATLTVQKRVAIALWKPATLDSYQSVANHFGVGKFTVGVAVMQVANAIV
ncbi:uncharacterized protein LOC101941939 isoform X3 [Chrysemys picta bellii]|uniref:uncharacterized protein LOC101941939 isoform X3 n=1 Tax=Chrysemys picta bellii TaxID=8478 RepID=UPI0032B203A9